MEGSCTAVDEELRVGAAWILTTSRIFFDPSIKKFREPDSRFCLVAKHRSVSVARHKSAKALSCSLATAHHYDVGSRIRYDRKPRYEAEVWWSRVAQKPLACVRRAAELVCLCGWSPDEGAASWCSEERVDRIVVAEYYF